MISVANWPREKRVTFIRRYAHRYGIARGVSSLSSSFGGFQWERVETALPWKPLALYAARHYGLRVVEVETRGRLRRRWLLKPQGARQL